jgi:hypothetical protein
LKKSIAVYTLSILAVLLIGIGTVNATPSLSGPVSNLDRPSTYALVHGWYRGADITYLDFGPSNSVAAPILAFFYASNPNSSVAGQNNIVDTIPGLPSYSDFWRVYKVLVPDNYVPNSIRSFDEALASGYTMEATNLIVNCPVVNPNSTTVGYNATLEQGWFRNRQVFYFNLGANTHAVDAADGFVLTSAPIYAFFYANRTRVPGQKNVVDVLPGNASYSDLWGIVKVTVDPLYVSNSLNSTSAINQAVSAGKVIIQLTGLYRNCPVVQLG